METSRAEVALFLEGFKTKARIFDIFYKDDRRKNNDSLLLLDIPPSMRDVIIFNLEVENYNDGPINDTMSAYDMGALWVFGYMYRRHEIYIKILMGVPNSSTICISFHLAEFPMNYPFGS
jgi:hypothetical protein